MPSVLRMLAENGIDTTELVAAIDNEDIHAVHAFFRKLSPTFSGTGDRHRSGSP